jgi:hypothetical protein
MSLQLPDLNKVVSGLTSFPPKLSSLIEPFASFEQQMSSSLPLPKPGPAASLEQMAQQFESSAGSLSLPQLPLPQLPFAQLHSRPPSLPDSPDGSPAHGASLTARPGPSRPACDAHGLKV